MCDCFHLAFPNWHAPAAGAGRRLRGPEEEAEDNSVCEDPEIVERERPRPQGSSPVEEFPIEKQAEEDISDLAHKSGSNKKGRKAGFGSLFDKRTSDKMNDTEDMQSGESEVIVKTVKEACVEGLVVTGGGKEGIFIKEVKVDSPASKHQSVKEGDQILSATVYFDNVSYEDALQILEHAQPYKMEFCLRRKVEPTIPENTEIKYPKEKDQGPPTMRNQRKMRKKQERISWPKFPSFGKGPRVQFKRSHSTSEAEEHRKLEMSPPTSDTESPLKSPLKCPDGKDKKKKHKVQLKMKMKGHRSKSVEEPQSSENELVWENQQVEGILEEKFPEGHEEKMQVLDGTENEVSFKTGNDEAFQSFSGMEMHEAHLISLGNTLKTTDISLALAETTKIESSEMKVRIYQKEKPDIGTEKQAESAKALHSISDPFACDNVVLSQTEGQIGQHDEDVSNQELGKDGSEKKVESGTAELSIPNLDICVGVTKTSPRISNERQLKDKSVFEIESYGIRTRGPLADIATSKSHFVSTVNGLQFMSSDFSEIMQVGKMSEDISDAKKPKPGSTVFAEDSPIVKTSKLPTETSGPEFKLPNLDLSGLVTHELINMTEVEKNRTNLPKREDIEIPGMENKDTKPIFKTPTIKVTKIEKIINITKDPKTDEEFNVEDVKVAVSKFPAFKLPEGDITGVLVQKEIELKSTLSPRGSPHKISITSTDSTIIPICKFGEDAASDTADKNKLMKMPKVEPPYNDDQTSTAVMKTDYTQSHLTDYERFGELNFKLPKREDIEIPGMEAIKETKLQNTADLDQVEKPRTKKHGDKKGHEKKSKKPKINIQGPESTKPDTQSSDIGSEYPKMDSSNINTEETKILEKQKFKTPNMDKVKNIPVQIQDTKILEDNMDNMDLPQKTETKFGRTKFKIPSVTLPEFGTNVTREEADIAAVDIQGKKAEQKLPEDKIKLSDKPLLPELNGIDINKDSQSVNVCDRAQDTETEGRKFKLPKFEISFPEVKAPRISCTSKKDDDSSLSEESGKIPVVHSPEGDLPVVKRADLPDKDSQTTEMKIKRPGFSLPRFGISKTEPIAPATDVTLTNVDMSLPEGHTKMDDPNTNIAISVKDCKDKDTTKFSSPTKFKIPSIRFPHFGVKVAKTAVDTSDVDVNVKGPEISLPQSELQLPEEPILIDIKTPDIDRQKESVGMELVNMDIQSEAQGNKFKLPKFGVKLPEVKGPKLNVNADQAGIDISIPEGKVQVNPPYIEVQGVTPKINVDVTGPEITLTDADMKISTEQLSVDIKGPDAVKGMKSLSVKMKDQDIQIKEKGSKFKSPKYEISLPEVKGPKVDVSLDKGDIDLSVPKAKVEIHPSNVEGQVVADKIKANLPEVDSKEGDIETKKTQGFLFPEIELRKSEVKATEGDIILSNVDVSLPEGSIEIERPSTDVAMSMGDAQQKSRSKFGSPTKFKLPSINFPKFGTKGPKASVEVSDVDVSVRGPEITLPDVEVKLSADPQPVDVTRSNVDKEMKPSTVEMTDQDIQMKEKGSKFKLPKFGISLPEVKGPKLDVNLEKVDSGKGKGVAAETTADLPEVDSKNIEMKIKSPGFSLSKIGFGKSEEKASEGNVSLPYVDVSLPEGSIEIEKATTDATLPMEDAEQKVRSKFGSPTKFKLPSISFPKFGTKEPKASVEVSDVDVDIKGPEITLPDAQMKWSAEPLSVDIKGPGLDKEMKSLYAEMKDQDIQMEEQESKFKLPKFGISLPEVKRPEIDKAEINISVPKAKVHLPDAELQDITAKLKADLPEVDSKDIELKMKTPGVSTKIGFSESELKAPKGDVSLSNVTVFLPEESIDMERPSTDIKISLENAEQKDPSKFKLPSISFPKFGTKGPKASVKVSDVDVDVKQPAITLPDAEMNLSAEPLSVTIKGPGEDKEMKPFKMEIKERNIQLEDQESKFKLPNFGISLPELKGPKIDISSEQAKTEISVPEANLQMATPNVKAQGVTVEIKADVPEVDYKDHEMKIKTSGFSFPKIDFSKSDVKASEGDESLLNIDMSLPKGSIEIERPATDFSSPMEDAEQKSRSKFGSPTKFKLPSISLPKFGTKGPKAPVVVADVDVDVKGPKISLADAENTLLAEPLSVDIKRPEAEKETKPLSMEIKDQDIQMKEQGSKFKLPKFGISLPDMKGPKIDIRSDKTETHISLPEANLEMATPNVKVQGVTAEIKADVPDVDAKDHEMKLKTSGFSFPKIDFGKSDVKASECDVSHPNVDMALPKGSIAIERPSMDVSLPMEDAEQKSRSKFGSPTKFKLPSISLPKFATKGPKSSVEVADVDVDVKGPEITAEIKMIAETKSVDIKGPDVDKEMKTSSVEIKDPDMQIKEKGSKFKLPKFGLSLPEVKGPKEDVSLDKVDRDTVVPKAKLEVQLPEVEMHNVTAKIKAELPEVDSKDIDVKIKTPGFSFPKIGFNKSDNKAAKADGSPQNVNVALHEGSLEIERSSTDVTIPMENAEQKGQSMFGSPTKFKLPSISFPKFGTKGPKASVEISDMDIDIKGPGIALPDAEMKLSAEPLSVDIKGPDAEKEIEPLCMEMKGQNIRIKEPKLPKFGISLPEVKGPKIDVSSDKAEIDIFTPKAKIHLPDADVQGITAELKADLPEDIELKMNMPDFSFPKIGFSKSELKAPKGDVSLANVDVSLPERSIEMEKLSTNITIPLEDTEQKDPKKFKLPSVNFPKFGTKGPKVSVAVADVDVDVKEPTITLPDVERNLSAEPLSVTIKGPGEDKEMKPFKMEIKERNIQLEDQESKFKLPNFGISLPELKGPKIDISSEQAETEISVPEANLQMATPNVKVQGVTVEIKADVPEVDSKDHEMKIKTSGFSFPKIDFSKSDVKASEGDESLLNIDMSLPKGSIEIERPATDFSLPMEDAEQKSRSKFGSPTKFKLPSISLPKFGTKGPKASVVVADVDVDAKGPKITLSDAEIKLSAEPLSVDIKGPDVDKEMKPSSVKIKDQDIKIKEKGSKFKLPKFEYGLSEVKGPKVDASLDKVDSDIAVPKGQGHPPDAEVQGVTAGMKGSLPKVDSKGPEIKMKTPSFSFPKIGFSKSEVKAPKGGVSLQNVDVSLPEESIDMERPSIDVTMSLEDAKQKDPTKFKLASMNLPKFGTKSPKASVEVSDVEVDVKGPEIGLADAEKTLPVKPLSVAIQRPDAEKGTKSLSMEIKDQNIQMKEQGSKFKLPKFGISLPDMKGPKIDISSDKAETHISLPEANLEMLPPNAKVQDVTAEIKADLPEVSSKDLEMKIKTAGFSFHKTALGKSDVKAPEGDVNLLDVDVYFPEGSIEIERPSIDVSLTMENEEQKSRSKFASPTKFKLPSVNFPKFGTKGPKASVEFSDVDAKGTEITLPDAEIKLSAEPLSVDIKAPHIDKEINPPNLEMKDEDVQMKEQWSKFKLPKLVADISLDKVDSEVSVPKAKVEVHPPDAEVHCVTAKIKAGLPEVDSKEIELKMKKPGLSFPKTGFDESEIKAPEGDVSFPNVDVAVSEESVEIERPATDVTISDTEHKVRSKFGSPTKFKLPSISFPKFGTKGPKAPEEVSDVCADIKVPEITIPDTKLKLSAEPLSVDVKGPVMDKEMKHPTVEMKDQDIQMKDPASKFKLPKFGISLPEVKGPKIDRSKNKAEIDISVAKAGVHPTEVEIQGVTAEIKADLSKSDVKASEGDVSLLNVDMSKGSIEIQRPSTDVPILMKDTEQKSRPKFGSPTKFKLPSINLPKFGAKGPKSSVDVFDVEVDVKGPEINVPDAEIKLSAEPLKVDIKGPDVDKKIKPPKVEMKDKDMQIKEQGGKFKLPKFDIRLPEIKAPKLDVRSDKADMDISVSKANVEVGLPDAEMHRVTAKIKADLPEVNSKDTEVKMRTPGFSFPGIGFSKPESKVPKGDVSHPNVDVTLPEGSIEIEKAATDVTLTMEDAEQKDQSKFSSQTKFKLPSINFPKFGTKAQKASVDDSDVDIDVKEPQISLPDTELKLSVEPIKVAVKRPDAEKEIKPLSVEVKDQDIQMKEKGSKFKLPNFGIILPEVKGPTFDASLDKAEIDISVPKAKIEVHPPDAEVQGVKAEIKADLPEVESKGIDVKMKGPRLSFPKFSTSDIKANNEVVITELDSQMEKCGEGDTAANKDAFGVILEPKQKYTKEVKMSSKSLSAKLGDVFSGFEVEFNVPTFDEIEETKQNYLETLKHEHKLNVSECISKPEDGETQEKSKAARQKQTTKDNVAFQSDIKENESKKSFTRDINEDYASPTLSLSSSDAFADESSALTSEQIGLSLASPTVVKVKYFEPTANAAVSEIHGDIITSTARCELISMDPHQPEKVNIPFSSETSSSSVDTLKQMSGHIVVSNVQSVSKTEHAAIFTRVDDLPSEKATDSMSVEETVIRKGHTIVEKHVVKKIVGCDKEKMFVTQKIQVFEGDSSEPISDDTAFSIQKLRDTVHTEKLKFFEGAESSKTVIVSTETLLRHADSSTDENEGK